MCVWMCVYVAVESTTTIEICVESNTKRRDKKKKQGDTKDTERATERKLMLLQNPESQKEARE